MTAPSHTPCATCGLCCRSYVVPLSGYDVWLISTRQQLAPDTFVIACQQEQPGADGFRLAPDGPTYGLALDKRGRLRAKQACVFLMSLGDRHDRCGIYDHRPVVCQVYPMSLRQSAVVQRTDALCPPDSWPEESLADAAWLDALRRQRMRFDVYHEVVARWNARADRASLPTPTLGEYLVFVMNAYARLAHFERELGERELSNVIATWPSSGADALARATSNGGEMPAWARYYAQARNAIDELYPQLERNGASSSHAMRHVTQR
jgi:Fe-S-cluster containining protein